MLLRLLLGALIFSFLPLAWAQSPALDLREQVFDIPLSVTGLDGITISGTFKLSTFRPAGDGPFPVIVLNHGRSDGKEDRRLPARARFEISARYFVRRGFVVASPTRLGYGETVEIGDPEASGPGCAGRDYRPQFEIGADHVIASLDRLKQEDWANTQRVVVMGISVGGLVSIGAVARRHPGIVAGINVAGGSGGNPVDHPGQPCSADRMAIIMAGLAHPANPPMLWMYAENDLFFGPLVARAWHSIYQVNGGRADFESLPPLFKDGHEFMGRGYDYWQPITDRWLAQFGFNTPGVIARPTATDFSALDEISALPYVDQSGRDSYAKFLDTALPRAFAISESGKVGFAQGDNALSQAIGNCQRSTGETCRLYAVDMDIVW